MTNSIYLRQASDGTDLGYNKAVTDAAVAVARSGDRRTYPATNPTGSLSYLNAAGTLLARASYPRTYLDTDTLTLTGKTVRTATNDATFAAALSAAGASSTPSVIKVAAGTYTGRYTVPTRVGSTTPGGSNIVIVMWDAIYDSMIANGGVSTVCPAKVRVTASDIAAMPYFKNTSTGNEATLVADGATSGWRFIGLNFGVDPTVLALSRITRMGNGDGTIQTGESLCPLNVGFDRCGFDGHTTLELKAAVEMHAKSWYVQECYFGDHIHHSGSDSQSIRTYNGPGPSRVVNNRLCASTEDILYGGATSQTACQPQDSEFRWNELTKSLTWNAAHPSYAGTNWSVKNLFEVKKLQYGLIEGNWMHGVWAEDQAGAALLLKSESYGDGAVNGYTHDLIVRWNLIEDASLPINIAGVTNTDAAVAVADVVSYGNLYKAGGTYYPASANSFFATGLMARCGSIHDTFIAVTAVNAITQPTANTGYYLIDSIFDANAFGIKGDGQAQGTATLTAYCTGYDVRKNALVGKLASGTGSYPAGNFFPTTAAAVGFTDYAGGDYSLAGTTQTGGGPLAVKTGLAITTQPSSIASGGTVSLVAQIVDQFGAPFAALATITASVASGTGTILAGASSATTSAGTATFAIVMSAAATTTCTLTLTATGLTGVTSTAFTITVAVPPAATSLSITTQPTATASGATMSPAMVVKVLDQFGAVFSSTATITLTSASGVATYTGTSAVAVAGVATFSSLVPTTATTGSNTLTASSAGLTSATSSAFTVTAPVVSVPTSLFVSTQPGNGTSGSALTVQPVVKVLDQFGAVYAHGGATITAVRNGGTATVTAGSTAVTSVGVATFSGLTLTDSVVSSNTLTFSSPGLTSVSSLSFTITPVRVATALAIVRQPAGSTSDVALTTQPQVAVVDQFGSIISSTATITASVGTGTASVTAGATAGAIAGTATFVGLTLHATTTGSNTLSFSAPGLTGVASSAFTVTVPAVAVATSLQITQQPGGSTSGAPLTTQPVVRVLDQFGVPITSGVTVTASVASGSASISGATTVASAGTATFATLTLTAGATNAVTLTFSAPGLTSVTSNAVTVTVTPTVRVATALAIETQPDGAASGVALLTQPRVLVVDQFGAQIASTATVTASIFSGSATISSGGSVAAVAGAAQYATLTMATTVTGQAALTFASPGLTSITSALFTVTAPVVVPPPDPPPDVDPDPPPTPIVLVATSLRIKVLPTAIFSGGIVSPPPEVEILDQNGDVLDIDTTPVTCTATGATVTAGGTDTTLDGLAVFNGLVVT